ncbi:MAG: hypothetical protein ACON39_04895 [Coraliomargaritaceae bacterium]
MIRFIVLLSCLFSQPAQALAEAADSLPDVRTLYREYIDASGGYLNLESLSSVAIKATVNDISGSSFEMSVYRKRSSKVRLRKVYENYIEELIYNGLEGWRELSSLEGYQFELKRLQLEEMTRAREMSRMEGPFYLVGRDERNISSLELDEVAGNLSYRVEVNPDSGLPYTTIWLDKESLEEVKIARKSKRSGNQILEEIYFTDPTTVEGHTFYQKQAVYVNGVHESTMEISSIRINIGIYDNYFTRDSLNSASFLSPEIEP